MRSSWGLRAAQRAAGIAAGATLPTLLLWRQWSGIVTLPELATLVLGTAVIFLIGLADDLRKLRIGSLGIPARLKLPIQALLAVPVAYGSVALSFWGMHQIFLPSSFWLLMVLAVIAIVATANAVNITDGMDGLAAGLSLIAIATVVLFLPSARSGEKAVALTLCGGLAAFLIFNRHPARLFMGDTGALAIGFALAAMAIQQGFMLLLPIVGLVFVLETLSVIIQVRFHHDPDPLHVPARGLV